jgi:hypothetical protein
MEDPEPFMRQLVRVFIDDGTFCPGSSSPAGSSSQRLQHSSAEPWSWVPRNYFTVWRATLYDLEQRNRTDYLELVASALAPVHFKFLDYLARITGAKAAELLDAAEADALEGF